MFAFNEIRMSVAPFPSSSVGMPRCDVASMIALGSMCCIVRRRAAAKKGSCPVRCLSGQFMTRFNAVLGRGCGEYGVRPIVTGCTAPGVGNPCPLTMSGGPCDSEQREEKTSGLFCSLSVLPILIHTSPYHKRQPLRLKHPT